jgi:hypothetical protein
MSVHPGKRAGSASVVVDKRIKTATGFASGPGSGELPDAAAAAAGAPVASTPPVKFDLYVVTLYKLESMSDLELRPEDDPKRLFADKLRAEYYQSLDPSKKYVDELDDRFSEENMLNFRYSKQSFSTQTDRDAARKMVSDLMWLIEEEMANISIYDEAPAFTRAATYEESVRIDDAKWEEEHPRSPVAPSDEDIESDEDDIQEDA